MDANSSLASDLPELIQDDHARIDRRETLAFCRIPSGCGDEGALGTPSTAARRAGVSRRVAERVGVASRKAPV
jgi:hypothetical protein